MLKSTYDANLKMTYRESLQIHYTVYAACYMNVHNHIFNWLNVHEILAGKVYTKYIKVVI